MSAGDQKLEFDTRLVIFGAADYLAELAWDVRFDPLGTHNALIRPVMQAIEALQIKLPLPEEP